MKFYLLSYVEKSKTDGHEASLVIFPGDPELIPPLLGAREIVTNEASCPSL